MHGEYLAMSKLHKTLPDSTPRPRAWGKLAMKSPPTYFFLCDFVDISQGLPDPVILGRRISELHKWSTSPTGKFGFHVPTYDGRFPQTVDWDSSWPAFFSKLLADIARLDVDTNGEWEELATVLSRTLFRVIPQLLGALEWDGRVLKPSLIHGDLWEGNVGTERGTGNFYIFDSCAYYAHNEMELGIWRTEHHRLNADVYKQEYLRHTKASKPVDEWDDRNRLYSVKTNLMYSAHFPGASARHQ